MTSRRGFLHARDAVPSVMDLHLSCRRLLQRMLHQQGMAPVDVEHATNEDSTAWKREAKKICGATRSMSTADAEYLIRFRDGLLERVRENEATGHDATGWWPDGWRGEL